MKSDAELARAFRDGDDDAFSALYNRHRRAIFVFGAKMLGDADAARDLVQEVFLKAYQGRSRMREPERLRAWLFAIARNRCLSEIRKRQAPVPLDLVSEDALGIDPGTSAFEADEEARLLRGILSTLKDEYREVLVLREYQELPYREIAEITQSSEDAVKSRLYKARKALHEAVRASIE